MDVIQQARELGKAIQQDERYLDYLEAKRANDQDADLQELIGKLNLTQLSYQAESEKEEPDSEKMKEYDAQFQEIYSKIMSNPNMMSYEVSRQQIDDLMNYIMKLLSLVVNGADPETAEPDAVDCTGSCSTCGGCG